MKNQESGDKSFPVEPERVLRNNLSFIIYLIGFFVCWTLTRIFLHPKLEKLDLLIRISAIEGIKLLIWVLPVFLYLKYIDKKDPFTYLKLNKGIKNGFRWVSIVATIFILNHLVKYLVVEKFSLTLAIGIENLVRVSLVGFTEETVFRGFILQKIEKIRGFAWANVLSSLLFIVVHFPIWYTQGLLFSSAIGALVTFVLIFGLIQGYVFERTDSLWLCIIIHSVNNFLVTARTIN